MGDRTRLFITGAVALAAVGVTVTGHGLWSTVLHNNGSYSFAIPLSQLRNFDGITVEGPDDVVVTPGDHYAVTLEGDKDAARYMNLYVKDGVLHVGRRSHEGWFGSLNSNVTVHVTMPGLSRLWLAGSGDLKLERFEGKELRALIVGSGNLDAENVKAQNVLVTVRGSGDAEMKGTTRALTVDVAGSGNVSFDDLAAETAAITVHGSGDVEARATKNATLEVAGSGDAHVSGTTMCQINKSGSGDAECTT